MTNITLVTANGEQHGLINTLSNHVPASCAENLNPKIKASLEKQKKEDNKMVKARYINHKSKHSGRLDKPYCKYAGDPIQVYHLIHGHIYELPMGFIEEVNKVRMPMRSGLVSLDGVAVNKDESPLEKDMGEIYEHELVPTSF